MILNAYDTTAGKPLQPAEHYLQTIKTLSLIGDLESVDGHPDIKLINHENNRGITTLSFPISYLSNIREKETVVDVRPFTNKKNVVINEPEYKAYILTGILQNLLSKNDVTVLKSSRNITTKAYANALSRRFAQSAGLDVIEATTLSIILAHFFITRLETKTVDYAFISKNVIRSSLGVDPSVSGPVVEDMGYVDNLADLVKYIVSRPDMYKLNRLTVKEFVALGATIWFSSVGRQVMAAALEHVPLFTAIVHATVNNNMYKNTGIGVQLDPKYNKDQIEAFNRTITNL